MSEQPTLDESTIAALLERRGIARRSRGGRGHVEIVNTDSIRHFALAYGDDNPLYCDPAHAESNVWGSPIAPPLFAGSAGRPQRVDWTSEQAATMKGDPLASMGQVLSGDRWVFLRPVRPGVDIVKRQCLDSAELRASTFGGGVGALVSHRVEFRDGDDGELIGTRYLDFWHTRRDASKRAAKNRDVPGHHYEPAELADLDSLYENEQVQGAETRRFADVGVGESLGTIAKGPLTLTDMVTYQSAIGFGGLGGGTSKVAYKNRQRVPRLYTANSFGVPDTSQRCHWDGEAAAELGHRAPYDYGQMRGNWMVHLLTNWMGDGGWISSLRTVVSSFNYVGDSHRISGAVTAVRNSGSRGEIDVEISGVNQRNEITCRATATVLLPLGADSLPSLSSADEVATPAPVGPLDAGEAPA